LHHDRAGFTVPAQYQPVLEAVERAGIKLIKGSVILNIMLRPKRNKDGTPCKVLIDLDNALKVAIDALNGIAYVDDKQVIEIHIVKGSAVNDGGLVVQILEGGNNDEA
jgi:crossover junction endodeoxyribonuclease RusA